jgi:thioredoxin 1
MKTLCNFDEFNKIVEEQKVENNNNLYLLFYTASWCGPCKLMYPLIERLSVQIPTLEVYKIDVDNDSDSDGGDSISDKNNVTTMPTFHLYKKGEIVSEMIGVNKIKLLKDIKIHI